VVLLNGLQLPDSIGDLLLGRVCPVSTGNPPSSGTFGNLEPLLKAQGFQVLFFDNCAECPGKTVEECGLALGRFLDRHAREAGAADEFDLIAHSMGGLIIRSWLAGKHVSGFAPPEKTRVRKAVFLGTPHFGSYTAVSLPFLPPQVAQLAEGSSFIWNLATWNQGGDDLRGIDALAVAGAGCPLGLMPEAGDGVVALTSASLAFAREPERTRVVPYRHTSTILGPCPARTRIANIDDATHLSYRAIVSFLTDTEEWRSTGLSAAEHPVLASYGGGVVEWQDEMGSRVASSRLLSGAGVKWDGAQEGRFKTNLHRAETTDMWFETGSGWVKNGAVIAAGGARPYLIKWGPWIGSVREEASGLVLRGANLTGLEVTVDGAPVRVTAASADSISVQWEGPAGLHKVEAAGPSGRATIDWYKP
jgi:pimeloyl-ACP methyl ester carboxylesterase